MTLPRLFDGYQTLITFAAGSTAALYEKEVTPPALTGGGPIDVTTMHNAAYRTMYNKSLKSLTEVKVTASYHESAYSSLLSFVNVIQLITVHFPDSHTYAFYGYLNEFAPSGLKEGDMPLAEVTIVCTNMTAAGVETGPVYT